MTSFILALSIAKTTVKANLGPKIFVVNLMIMDLTNSLCTFYNNVMSTFPEIADWWRNFLGLGPHHIGNEPCSHCVITTKFCTDPSSPTLRRLSLCLYLYKCKKYYLAWRYILHITYFLKHLTLAVFTCSMVPMTVMSILACYRPKAFTGNTAAKYFALLVILAGL